MLGRARSVWKAKCTLGAAIRCSKHATRCRVSSMNLAHQASAAPLLPRHSARDHVSCTLMAADARGYTQVAAETGCQTHPCAPFTRLSNIHTLSITWTLPAQLWRTSSTLSPKRPHVAGARAAAGSPSSLLPAPSSDEPPASASPSEGFSNGAPAGPAASGMRSRSAAGAASGREGAGGGLGQGLGAGGRSQVVARVLWSIKNVRPLAASFRACTPTAKYLFIYSSRPRQRRRVHAWL